MSEGLPEDAEEVRSRPLWFCFEEPKDPMIWLPGEVAGINPSYCEADHPKLGCGWYRLNPSTGGT